ncbi:MAG TPA: SOS response-associated peptidase [Caulobacteraceae bacterium]|nr:SOS response-associated peptidase [Caulobacteraceae bacterium]
MCNDYGVDLPFSLYVEAFSEIRLPLKFPVAAPNLEPRDEIWPTERAPIIRAVEGGVALEQLRWGWKAARPKGPPIINLRGEGRSFHAGRCLIPATHFYEFTGAGSPKRRWKFTRTGEDWFCLAGVIGRGEDAGAEVPAFTMLTCEPGPDVAPIHNRQVVVLERADWARWLDPVVPAAEMIRPSPIGTLTVVESPRGRPTG